MSSQLLLDATGRRRSPAATPGHNAGHAPRNKGHVYPADPPTVDEIVAVIRQTPADRHGLRLRALIVVLWRGGLRIQEALSLIESDLDPRPGSILIRAGKGIAAGRWGSTRGHGAIISLRGSPPGSSCRSVFCSDGPTRGRPWSATAARCELDATRRRPVCGAGLPRISSVMLTRSSSPGRGCRCR
jgi:hypothetical protein